MRALIQRAAYGKVEIDGETVGEIGAGLVILLGVAPDDTRETSEAMAKKCRELRIFEDGNGKMNLSLSDIGGEALVISQFTLYADTVSSGRRPSFSGAARPDVAIPRYEEFVTALRALGTKVETGRFGADMKVSLLNDGPVTIMLELPKK